jgi:hypothetical protein
MSSFALRHLAAHLRASGQVDRLFELVERRGFLATQAGALNGFRQGSDDVESHVLPVALERLDWPRFFRHAVVAANLRGLAEALAEPEILSALVAHRPALAFDLVDQLTDPQQRARARAVISTQGRGIDALLQDLNDVPSPTDDATAAAWLATLRLLARHRGPELRREWPRLIGRLSEAARVDDAWQAVAESWLARGNARDPDLWDCLANLSAARLRAFLPGRLADLPDARDAFLEAPLPPPFADDVELLWHVRLAILGVLRDGDPRPHLERMPIALSTALVENGRRLWPRLGRDRLAQLTQSADATARAALLVTVLEADSSAETAATALEALDALADAGYRLRWSLRYLAAVGRSEQTRSQVRAVAAYLYDLRYDAPPEDLARFLDLVADEPKELARQVGNVVWAPTSTVDGLRRLAAAVKRPEVLENLLENAEKYAAAVSQSGAEGFELRRDLKISTASRLCALREDLESLRGAAEFLLREEEDELRVAVVDALLTGDDPLGKRRELAAEACAGIASPRLRLLARLRAASGPAALEGTLSPAALYEAVADSAAVEDELRAAAVLVELPQDPDSLAREHLLPMREGDHRIRGLADLARHALAFQRRVTPRHVDAVAALLPLRQSIGGVSTDERLAAMTPELVELGAEVGTARAVAEFQEAILRLLRLDTVPWTVRVEALATLLGRLTPERFPGDRQSSRARERACVTLLEWIGRLPVQPELAELTPRWPELLAFVVAAAERLPEDLRCALGHPWRLRIPWLARLESFLPATPWSAPRQGLAVWAGGDSGLLDACFGSVETLAERVARDRRPSLVALLATKSPQRAQELLARLPAGERETLGLGLLRQGWLDVELAAATLDGAEARLWMELRRRPDERDAEAWLAAFADRLSAADLDPLDPLNAPLRRALWEMDSARAAATLGRAVVAAITAAGRPGGERALLFWLQAWLRPRLGHEAPDQRERVEGLWQKLAEAAGIAGTAVSSDEAQALVASWASVEES